jgi:hypothetical protein
MYSWTTRALLDAAEAEGTPSGAREALASFLERVYHELRNLGITAQDRALNHAATNAFNASEVFSDAVRVGMQLHSVAVDRSPICRPDSDCWDVKLIFFNPMKLFEQAKKVYRFTVDVSDLPVAVGPVRSWFTS